MYYFYFLLYPYHVDLNFTRRLYSTPPPPFLQTVICPYMSLWTEVEGGGVHDLGVCCSPDGSLF